MEELFAEFYLWYCGVNTNEKYEAFLHKTFLIREPGDKFLLELEECSSDIKATYRCFMCHWEKSDFDFDGFKSSLFEKLKVLYGSDQYSLHEFVRKCFSVWKNFPFSADLYDLYPFDELAKSEEYMALMDEAERKAWFERFFLHVL